MTEESKTAKILRITALSILFILGALVFLFALLSGSEDYGGGFIGILKNSPNALPWLILLLFTLIARRWPLIGGGLIVLLSIALFLFFNFGGNHIHLVPSLLCLILFIPALMLIISWKLEKHTKNQDNK